jgi:type I restriction enzyme S subunit
VDIIISARGTVGAMAQLKREMAFNQSCYGLREVKDISDNDFLFYRKPRNIASPIFINGSLRCSPSN